MKEEDEAGYELSVKNEDENKAAQVRASLLGLTWGGVIEAHRICYTVTSSFLSRMVRIGDCFIVGSGPFG